MKIEEAQEMMRKVYLERDRARGVEGTLRRTFEELDELQEAIENKGSTHALADEIADVFAWLCSLANLLEIDVSKAFYKKYNNSCSKCKRSPCVCPEALDLK
ncbi:MAG: MazG nucleotide pyrophosphohydrolase domain-containing protein [Candidatus Thorarchaeota archaeon]